MISPLAHTPNPDWIALAAVGAPHGVRGQFKLHCLDEKALDYLSAGTLCDAHGNPAEFTLYGRSQGMAIVSLKGVITREEAQRLRGKQYGTTRASLPELDAPHRYYVHDLVGLRVVDAQNQPQGSVVRVVNYGASDIIEIDHGEGETALYAFTHATFPEIDVAAGYVRLIPPEIIE
jgi:16S rRNA processing protein RimM